MKYYFDTSSLVKLYHREEGTDTVLKIYKGHDDIIISELSKIEFISIIYRKYREHEISNETVTAVVQKFENDMMKFLNFPHWSLTMQGGYSHAGAIHQR